VVVNAVLLLASTCTLCIRCTVLTCIVIMPGLTGTGIGACAGGALPQSLAVLLVAASGTMSPMLASSSASCISLVGSSDSCNSSVPLSFFC
jgi:hypothetical protein